MNIQNIIDTADRWVRMWIVRENLCPFAGPVAMRSQIRFAVCEEAELEVQYQFFLREMSHLLDADPEETETSLLIFPSGLEDFEVYLDFAETMEEALVRAGLEGTFQVATFHPDYQFADTEENDVENYTNRSPYPMLHLLREESVEAAIASYGNVAIIPERNIAHMRKMGLEAIRERHASIGGQEIEDNDN